jgi:MFS family permease
MEAQELTPLTIAVISKAPTTTATTPAAAASYSSLLRHNRPFAFYLASYITNHTGEWLTYLASLTALHEISSQGGESSATAIALLVAVRMLTNVAASPAGGVLADAVDRRVAMVVLDFMGASVAWLFWMAVAFQSVSLIYMATVAQQIVAGLYEPSRSAIVPLLVPEPQQLEKATILMGMAWSTVAAVASASGGFLVTWLGLQGCFVVDSLTYVGSALLLLGVKGNWSVVSKKATTVGPGSAAKSSTGSAWYMLQDGFTYVRHAEWGPLVGLKFCATWMTMDVLLVAFAERVPEQAPLRMGTFFASVGIGCLIGPQLADPWTDTSQPRTLQWACLAALGVATTACGLLALPFDPSLWCLCALMVMRAIGISALWIYSSLLLQLYSDPAYLGRVSAIDYALALIGEASSALVTGRLVDVAGWSPEQVCAWLAGLGAFFCLGWLYYTLRTVPSIPRACKIGRSLETA